MAKKTSPVDETVSLKQQLAQREAELEVINSVQQGLAAALDFQAIVDLVGDKLREVFETANLVINWYDDETNLRHFLYNYQEGKRVNLAPVPSNPAARERFFKTGEPFVVNSIAESQERNVFPVPGTDSFGKSLLYAPILGSKRTLGLIGIEDYERENAFGEAEIRLVTTIAASLGTALENARLFDETQRLLKETEQRNAELSIINSVQQALASKLDMQAIYDLVGEKIRGIFDAQVVIIGIFNRATDQTTAYYAIERGMRLENFTVPIRERVLHYLDETHQPLVFNANATERAAQYGIELVPGTESPQAMVFVPLIVADEVKGNISLQNLDRENAFSESDVRLLQTLANSMSVALENARLFDETQRLFKAEQQRAAELAIINSVQEGLATKLNMQAIYDLVGDKIQQIFDAQVVTIIRMDLNTGLSILEYGVELGKRIEFLPTSFTGLEQNIARTRQTILVNENAQQRMAELGAITVPGTAITRSNLFVPMLVGDDLKGYVSLQNVDRDNAFSESDVRLLQTLTNSMSVALENARLFDETQRLLKETEQRNAELAIINSVQRGLASKLNIQSIYEMVGEQLHQVFPQFDISVGAYEPEDDLITTGYMIEHGKRIDLPSFRVGNMGFIGQMIRTGKTILVNENMEEESTKVGSRTLEGTDTPRSHLLVPLIIHDVVRGLVVMQDMEREHAFSDSDVRLLETITSSMSVALENARLFDETQRLLKITEQRAAELAIISSVQQALASKLDMQAIYDLVGDKIQEIFDAQSVLIAIFDQANELTHIPYNFELGQRYYSNPYPFTGLHKKLIHTGQTILINEDAERRFQELGMVLMPGTQPSKSMLFVPLNSGSGVNGVISLQNIEREHAFSESDVRLLETLASSMSVALENARLFDETQRLLKETEQRAAELQIINSVQAGLARKLDLQEIVDLVGEKIGTIFAADTVSVGMYDSEQDWGFNRYYVDRGERIPFPDSIINRPSLTA
ncbi:MAG TPA: GAF domain-containing protein, partial [Anaerolineales bacterium]|nr:GAF domain-containing protein [Anaerolineales bacterium]